MAYCDQQDIIAAIGVQALIDLTDDDGLNSVSPSRVDAAIASADTLIDSFLRERYTLPLSPVPVLARDVSVELAIVNLAKRRFVTELPPAMKDRRDAAVRLLEKLANGTATLDGATAADASTAGIVRSNERCRLFGDLSAY